MSLTSVVISSVSQFEGGKSDAIVGFGLFLFLNLLMAHLR